MQGFDLIVIGAGSGGIAAANRASQLNAKVLLVDKGELGGTCVNVGCVPKKFMWYASEIAQTIANSAAFGFEQKHPHLDWQTLIEQRQQYIKRIHQSYQRTFENNKITYLHGEAKLVAHDQVQIDGKIYQAPNILIATGGHPNPPKVAGAEYGITSDEFFELPSLPNKVVVVGGGYIAVELAGILQSLGSQVHHCMRHQSLLRSFDPMLSEQVESFLVHQGVTLHKGFNANMVQKQPNGQFCLHCQTEEVIRDIDCVLWAIGRSPNTQGIGLEEVGVQLDDKGFVITDDDHNTNVKGIYAIGDITHNLALTPVAIRAGRRLSARLFGQTPLPLNKDCIPTVLFSHPPIGTCGLNEQDARQKYGDSIKVYQTSFKPMAQAPFANPIPFHLKLITQGKDEKVVGCHIAGVHADEILQGFAVAMNMGATKQDFDNTIAIHPTNSEELVLMR